MAPQTVGVTDAVQVVAGFSRSCARRSTGTVACWGASSSGQVGDGSRVQRPAPTSVRSIADAAGLSTGSNHICARRANGQVLCWGFNDEGQLGDN